MGCNCGSGKNSGSKNTSNKRLPTPKARIQIQSSSKPNLSADQRRIKRLKEESIRKNLNK